MRNIILIAAISLLIVVIVFLVAVYGLGFLQRETADFRGENSLKNINYCI